MVFTFAAGWGIIIVPDIKTKVCGKGAGKERNPQKVDVFAVPSGMAFFFGKNKKRRMETMETRVAVMSVIVEDADSVEPLNALLHQYGQHIIGRMGLPYRARGINIISIAIDAPQDTISTLAGRIGALPGVSVKTAFSNQKGGVA